VKLALICPYAWDRPGGVQSHVRSLAPVLARRGHEVAVVAPLAGERPVPPDDYDIHFVGHTMSVPANGSVAPIAYGRRAAAEVKAALDRIAPDVVQAHEPLIPSISLHAVNSTDAPVVGTFHAATESSIGYWVAQPYLKRAAARMVCRTAVSPAARALAGRYFPGDYAIVPNGIDVDRFTSADPLDFGLGKSILFLGRIEKRKGLEVLIQAVARLGDLDVRLVVVGDGPRLDRSRRLAQRLDVNCEWLGRVSDDDVPRAYKGAGVYCAPNLGGESFGIVLLEAMAAGTPIVCSSLQAFEKVAGEAASFAPPGDVGRLAAALRDTLERPERARVDAGLRHAKRYDWGALAEALEDVFRSAAERAVTRPDGKR
jgi:phosphatidylinositol alpha-mannosyltransferase